MAIHDVDKESQDRSSPTPNTSDVVIDGALKAHKTISSHYGTDADTSVGQLQMQNKQILANDGTTNVGLYGYNPALNAWGFFLTDPGTDVTTNTDLTKFIFNSNQDILKIILSGTTSIPSTTSLNTISIPHGLGFQPFLIAFAQSNIFGAGQTYLLPHLVTATNSAVTGAFVVSVEFGAYTDSTNLNFYIRSAGVSANATITYYVVQESAA